MSTYHLVIGLPVSIRVAPDGTLDFEVDTGDLVHEILRGDEISIVEEGSDDGLSDEALYALADRVAATLANAEQSPYAVIPAR